MSEQEEEQRRFRTALRRFALAITVLNLLGHTVLGFEQSTWQVVVALGSAYSLELLLALVSPHPEARRRAFGCGWRGFIDFLLPAHITGLAVAMLLYANERLWVIAFAAVTAIGSKVLFRAPYRAGSRHFLNPSNFGIAATLLFFPWVGVAPPYQFTEEISGAWDWVLPALIVCTGSLLNWKLTRRMPLIAGWLLGFFLQAVLRHSSDGTPLPAALMPMTGLAFVLFTFYMVTDPMTTPGEGNPLGQVAFGASVAGLYGVFVACHIVFGMFFALAIVCGVRGLCLYLRIPLRRALAAHPGPAPAPAAGAVALPAPLASAFIGTPATEAAEN